MRIKNYNSIESKTVNELYNELLIMKMGCCIILQALRLFNPAIIITNEYILDPTAGQVRDCNPWQVFRRIPLTRDDCTFDWWRVYKRVTAIEELVAYQIKMDWPEEQICPKRFRKVKKVG